MSWFRHDCDAHNDPKLCAVMAERGIEGYGAYFLIVELLAKEASHELPLSVIPGIAFKLRVDTAKIREFVDLFVSLELLERSETHFWSASLKRRMQQIDQKREQTRNRVTRYRSVTPTDVTQPVTPATERYCSNQIKSNLINSDLLKSNSDQIGSVTERPPEPGIVRLGDFCEVDEISLEAFKVSKGADFIERCAEVTNGWVGEVRGNPIEFESRRARAKNAGFLWQNWVFARVAEERAKAEKFKGKPEKATGNERISKIKQELAAL